MVDEFGEHHMDEDRTKKQEEEVELNIGRAPRGQRRKSAKELLKIIGSKLKTAVA